MTRVPRRLIQVVLIVLLMAIPLPASAQTAATITLKASDKQFAYGKTTRLFGSITPETAAQPINILDEAGAVVATTETDASGAYSVKLAPRSNISVRAEWAGTMSEPVPLGVRPILRVNLGKVRLFDKGSVWGRVAPGNVPGRMTLTLRRYGKPYQTRSVAISPSGRFKTKFNIEKPGGHKVTASYRGGDHLPASASSKVKETPQPSLSTGSNSIYVKLLERRLKELNYKAPTPNKSYDYRTSDAVTAFNKVQGRSRVGYVTGATWRALAQPKIPRARFDKPGYHIEVDQSKQVLYRVKNGKVISILPVSTGKPSTPTYNGTFRFWSKLAGYSSKRLYYPSFFDGGRAIHGWPEVPTYAASHGCVRIPMWMAVWMFGKTENGDTIHVYR